MVPPPAAQRLDLRAARGHRGVADLLPATPLSWPPPGARIVARRPLGGGYVSASVELLELGYPDGRTAAVVRKRALPAEAAALRALAAVPAVSRPALVAAGRGWLAMPYYAGSPPRDGSPMPAEVYETLARVHVHFGGRGPAGLPVVDPAFWRRLCLQRALPAVRGAARRSPDPRLDAAAVALASWAGDPDILAALGLLPATMCHGDPHRGNVLVGPDGATLIDWGNARLAPGGLDLAVLAAQGGTGQAHYHRVVAELTGGAPVDERCAEVERQWSVLAAHVQYLAFAADHLGPARVGEMVDIAGAALRRLGDALRHG